MAEASAATPTSSVGKQPAAKDKECPFCHQPFTSSSLGRHLDLYIKEKNPKPPDNVHDIEEIRKIRGTITRRQARSSLKHNDDSTPSSSKATPLREQGSPSVQKSFPAANNLNAEDGPSKLYWNQPHWQATGVINDLPPISREDQIPLVRRRTPSRGSSIKEDLTRRQRGLDERDRGQAAELALKEVLENVRSASARAHPSAPFDFNFFSLSLPQIYLKCLSPPPELLSEPPYLSQATWPIDPPSGGSCEVARSWLQDRLHDWRRQRENLRFSGDAIQNGANGYSAVNAMEEAINNEEAMYNEHLTKAHQKWANLSDKERNEQWHYECTKALAREREQHQATARKLSVLEQEVTLLRNHLAVQNNAPMEGQEHLQYQPTLLPLSEKTISHLAKSTPLDFEALLTKWKSRIKSARSTQFPLPNSTSSKTRSENEGRIMNRLPPPTSPMQFIVTGLQEQDQEQDQDQDQEQDQEQEQDEDEDLEDAPGEDEDESAGTTRARPDAQGEGPADQGGTEDRESRGRRRVTGPEITTRGPGESGEMDVGE